MFTLPFPPMLMFMSRNCVGLSCIVSLNLSRKMRRSLSACLLPVSAIQQSPTYSRRSTQCDLQNFSLATKRRIVPLVARESGDRMAPLTRHSPSKKLYST
eukprot:3841575-Pleurochrysis_carterae.AAC.1